jgi:hypothetical protein
VFFKKKKAISERQGLNREKSEMPKIGLFRA